MKSTKQSQEMDRFNDALRQVMSVSKKELATLLSDADAISATRQKRGPRPKSSALVRASPDED